MTHDHANRHSAAETPLLLDCERLDCYRVAIEFQTLAGRLTANRRMGVVLRDQLDRASVSIVLNIAEGAGRFTAPDKARFFAVARGSASECAGVLELLLSRGLLTPAEHRHARGLVVRIVQMLTRLGYPRVTSAHTEERLA